MRRNTSISWREISRFRFFLNVNEPENEIIKDIKEDEVIKILGVEPSRRSKVQIINLTNYLKKIQFFKEYVKDGKEQIVERCSKHLLIQSYKQKSPIIKEGEIGQEFFIILKGKISVYLQKVIEPLLTYKELLLFIKNHTNLISSIDGKTIDESLIEIASCLNSEGKFQEDFYYRTE